MSRVQLEPIVIVKLSFIFLGLYVFDVDVFPTCPLLRRPDGSHSKVYRFQIINDFLLTYNDYSCFLTWAYCSFIIIIPLNVTRYIRHNTLLKYYKGDNCLSTLSKNRLLIITYISLFQLWTICQLLLKGISELDSSLQSPNIS